jgi:formate dehydrogenase subunit gamma
MDTIAAVCMAEATRPGGLLPALHAIQDAVGFIPPESVPVIADTFNLARAEVHGVLTFYHDFRTEPPAKHAFHICRAEACQSMGAERLVYHAEARLGCRMKESAADQHFSLEPVYCLGHCAASPAIMVDGAVHARVTPERFDAIFENLIAQAGEQK